MRSGTLSPKWSWLATLAGKIAQACLGERQAFYGRCTLRGKVFAILRLRFIGFDSALSGTINLASQFPTITAALTIIDGPGRPHASAA
ncbi:MAG: hypothetical protein RH917_02985 [Lacipirellulaceae bacterium]